MAVQTANTLFRFTGQLSHLLSVLSDGFSPRLSRETDILGQRAYHPMVCFCDIPLAMVDNHMFKYGYYGVGMTKEWGIKNGLNPILYYNEESILIKNFFNLVSGSITSTQELYRLAVGGEWIPNDGGSSLQVDHHAEGYKEKHDAYWQTLYRIFAIQGLEKYFKPRIGEYIIGDKHYPDYHFYDEREWRYLAYNPTFDMSGPAVVDEANMSHDPLNNEEKERINKKIEAEGKFRLTFNAADIKYIIIKNENEILPVVQHLKSLTSSNGNELLYTPDEIILLTSRILTTTQITEDF